MATQQPQNFRNHRRNPPPPFQAASLVFVIYLGWTIYRLVKFGVTFGSALAVLLAMAFLVLSFYTRHLALVVQDRLIRLEMRLRLAELLPSDLRPRIPEFTLGQLIALRFAGDAELPALARKVLDEKIDDRKAIKQLITDWQADNLRV